MQPFVHALVLLVETLFFTGLVGSVVVVVLSSSEDIQELLSSDEPAAAQSEPNHR